MNEPRKRGDLNVKSTLMWVCDATLREFCRAEAEAERSWMGMDA